VPVPDPTLRGVRQQIVLTGDVPSPANPPSGCRFHTRCWLGRSADDQALCAQDMPELVARSADASAHLVACHFPQMTAASLR